MKSYLQILKDLREDKDLKQSDIAELLGVSQQQYSKYESGVSDLPIPQLLKLADFYDISLDDLFSRSGDHATSIQAITGINKTLRGEYKVGTLISDVLSLNVSGRDAIIEYIRLQKLKADHAKNKASG